MQQFSIKAMERLTGIKAHTLRVWEQRYGILNPLRKEGNHRYYSNEDLKSLLRMVFLYQNGFRIGEIARLSGEEIHRILSQELPSGGGAKLFIIEMMEAILVLDEKALDEIFQRAAGQFGFLRTMLEVVFPLLNRMGLLWMADRLVPGQEHFASHFMLRKTLLATNNIELRPSSSRLEKVLVFAPKGEFHEIGPLFMNYLFRLNGFKTVYLGSNTDLAIVDLYYQTSRPTHIMLHLTANLQDEDPEEYIKTIVERYPEAGILVGGQVVREIQDMPGCKILRTQEEMLECSRQIPELS